MLADTHRKRTNFNILSVGLPACLSVQCFFLFFFVQFQFVYAHEVLADFIDKFDNYANFKDMI